MTSVAGCMCRSMTTGSSASSRATKNCVSSIGRTTGPGTAIFSVSISFWRWRTTAPTATSSRNRPMSLMLFYLFSSEEIGELFERLGYPFEYETIPREHRLLCRPLVSRAPRYAVWCMPGSWRVPTGRARSTFFAEALQSDVSDVQQGTTAEGVHLGAMAGTVDQVQRVSTGIEVRGDVLRLNPELPREMESPRHAHPLPRAFARFAADARLPSRSVDKISMWRRFHYL